MRRKLILLSALTCLAGGSTLLAQAQAQSKVPPCEEVIGTECDGGSMLCTTAWGAPETLFCYDDGIWNWGW